MDEIINLIDLTVENLITSRMNSYSVNAQKLINSLLQELPGIISLYSDDRMKDISGDATYWPGQLERIIGALEAGDDFSTIDILVNETKANLIELKKELCERGVLHE